LTVRVCGPCSRLPVTKEFLSRCMEWCIRELERQSGGKLYEVTGKRLRV
jgi:hypothetical protein